MHVGRAIIAAHKGKQLEPPKPKTVKVRLIRVKSSPDEGVTVSFLDEPGEVVESIVLRNATSATISLEVNRC